MTGEGSFVELLHHAVSPFASLTDAQAAALYEHWVLLQRWNQKLNLTRIDSLESAVHRHYAESLFLAAQLSEFVGRDSVTVADVGSGAGFPGVPVAVFRPDWRVTLIESHKRKSVFLAEAARQLPNLSVLASRVEALTEKWDLVVSRAVAWADISCWVRANARFVGLLAGPEDVEKDLGTAGFIWREPVRVLEPGRGFVLLGLVLSST